jgi:ParB family transcriptional regulator, chromosome partitioning protein
MHLEVISIPVDNLVEYNGNARTHSDAQVKQIANSIEEFGWTVPVLVDERNCIMAGHGRVRAARKLGMVAVPAIRLDHLTETQKKALVIGDNKLTLNGAWDMDTLALELEALKDDGFDVTLTGFSTSELDDIASMCVPGSLEDIDNAVEEPKKSDDETRDWPKIHLKVPEEVHDVFLDIMAKCPGQKPHEKFAALLGAVDVLALEELGRLQSSKRRDRSRDD